MNFLKSDFLEPAVLLNAIFKTAIDGIITIDESGIIQLANPAAAHLFFYQPEELIGKNISMLMAEPHHSKHDGYLENYFRTGQKKIIGIGRESEGKRKDGSLFPIRISVSEIKIKNRTFFTGIITDLSEQREAEEKIRSLNQQLEQRVKERTEEINQTMKKLIDSNERLKSEIHEREKVESLLRATEQEIRIALQKEKELNELKSRFITMASHEFRTPLSTILSSASLIGMHNKQSSEQISKHLVRIRSAVNNLTGILNDFLSLSKLEEGKIKLRPEWFSFPEFCEEVIDEIKGLLKEGQEIVQEDHMDTQQVFLDQHLLKNIIFNLLSNAIKYSPPKSKIYCISEIENGQLRISIRDEGIGIPEADQVYLFSRFFRASNVTNIQGTGLGLNIVKQYVNLMDGDISFESKSEQGSTFSIELPIQG